MKTLLLSNSKQLFRSINQTLLCPKQSKRTCPNNFSRIMRPERACSLGQSLSDRMMHHVPYDQRRQDTGGVPPTTTCLFPDDHMRRRNYSCEASPCKRLCGKRPAVGPLPAQNQTGIAHHANHDHDDAAAFVEILGGSVQFQRDRLGKR